MIKSFAYNHTGFYAPIKPFLAMATASKQGGSISYDCDWQVAA